MSSEKIFEKIRQDAENEAASILTRASEQAGAVREGIIKKARAESEKIVLNAEREAAETEQRETLATNLEARKRSLKTKRALIDEAFDIAESQINGLPEKRWEKLISEIVVNSAVTGNEILRVPAADTEKYNANNGAFLENLSKSFYERTGVKASFKLDGAPADFAGGVKIIGEICDVNGSFKVLLRGIRERYEPEIAALLFQTEVL